MVRSMLHRVLLFSALLLLFRITDVAAQDLQVSMTETGGLTLRAEAVPLSRILATLQKRYQLTVTIPDFRDTVVTANFEDVPLADALTRLLPKGQHASFTFGDREIDVRPNTGDKPGRRTPRNRELPRKDTLAVMPLIANAPSKRDPDQVRPRRLPPGARLKPMPTDTIVRGGKGPKVPRAPQPDTAKHLWLALLVDSTGVITVEGARVMQGRGVVSSEPGGEYFYTVSSGPSLIAAERLYDPFEQHAYGPQPTDPHRTARARVGHFTATVPYTSAERLLNNDIVIRLHRTSSGASSLRFDLERARESSRNSEVVASSRPGALRAPLREALQRGPQR